MTRVALDGFPLQVRSAGVAVYTAALARALAALRPEVELVLFGLRAPGLRSPSPDGQAPTPANLRTQQSWLYPLVMGQPLPLPRIALEHALGDIDVFHATAYAAPIARRAAVVVTVHDLALLRFPELGTAALRRLVARTAASAATAQRVIAVSETTRRDLIALCAVPAEKICVVPNGCDPDFVPLEPAIARARVAAAYGIEGPYILHVGTLEPRKNLGRLVDAIARLHAAGHTLPLVLAGAPGWGAEALDRVIAASRLGESVRRLGRVSAADLPALYGAATLFTYPSLYEGFGLPPLEAVACGTPVVASNAGALPEVLGDAALLVDPLDEGALAAAMQRLLTDRDLRAALRERGLARARQFTWARCARATWAVYEAAWRTPAD